MNRRLFVAMLLSALLLAPLSGCSSSGTLGTGGSSYEPHPVGIGPAYSGIFCSLYEGVGSLSYDEAIAFVEGHGYEYTSHDPGVEEGEITVEDTGDGEGSRVYMCFLDNGGDGNWTLTMILYGNIDYAVTVTDHDHTTDVSYKTFDSTLADPVVVVDDFAALDEFLRGVAG